MPRFPIAISCCALFAGPAAQADEPYALPPSGSPSAAKYQPPYYPFAPAAATILFDKRLPRTELPPAVAIDGLCKIRYRAATPSAECQAFIDQGLGYFYSYVWMEAARSFETALTYDPDCAFAWLGLARAFDKWDQPAKANKALERAKALLSKAAPHEKMLITAKLQEKGMLPGVGPDERKKKAAATLDELLVLYPDDEEAWFARAQINGGAEGAVFYRTLLRVNPVHPGASHELVHYFDNTKRPALGWPHALAYMESSPKIPHAFHMQAHLAMHIGKWEKTTDWSAKAVELEREYHRVQNVDPKDDHQYSHHLEILMTSLLHDGRIAEARTVKAEADKLGYTYQQPFLALANAERNWDAAEELIRKQKRGDKVQKAYQVALLDLERGNPALAAIPLEVLGAGQRQKRGDKKTELNWNTAQGWYLCQTGNGEAGLKLLKRAVDQTKDDYSQHNWGRGASLMEIWGTAALQSGNATVAEEAFQEALAHDAGSAKGALGLYALCLRLDRREEADRYLKLARRIWAHADAVVFESTRDFLVAQAANIKTQPSDSAARK